MADSRSKAQKIQGKPGSPFGPESKKALKDLYRSRSKEKRSQFDGTSTEQN